jgi:hypothetical protein
MTGVFLGAPVSKPPLGGWLPAAPFSDARRAALDALADTLIPGGDGFPAPSQVDVAGFVARYVTPAGQEARWYPFLDGQGFAAQLDAVGPALVAADGGGRVRLVEALERDAPEFFTRIRDLVYQAYYSRPEVVRASNETLPAGRDYRITPQPFGYSSTILDWDDDLLSRVQGTYTLTKAVARVPLPDDLAGPGQKARSGEESPLTLVEQVRLEGTGAP